jgi:hypothetical protein
VPSFFFTETDKNYVRTTVDFEEAQRSMRETPLPSQSEIAGWGGSSFSAKSLAGEFAHTFSQPARDLVDKMVKDRVSRFVNDELDEEAERKK